ncbi:hypothetical protein AXG93_4689s1110 [Marchantia polymorpha subsp. ruderalis]|uniref:Haloacid dehalogenase-like hydrolase domain-containing protein Sgpp n=1 Tax=Marchantia polymorpha subsp. ruderalis TaxID=1480154 RepID=A0A176WMH5_MARPO|nr:hypothetical protein AXG93_4689s1110 [Marchantia polymorpha subsp. ruderalis]
MGGEAAAPPARSCSRRSGDEEHLRRGRGRGRGRDDGAPSGAPGSDDDLVNCLSGEPRSQIPRSENSDFFTAPAGLEQPAARNSTDDSMGKPFPSSLELKAILFDVDGTITDSDPLHFQAFKEIFQQARAEWGQAGFNNGEPMTKEYFLKQISGKLNSVIAAEHFPLLDEPARAKITEEKEARFRRAHTVRSTARKYTPIFMQCSVFVNQLADNHLIHLFERLSTESCVHPMNAPFFDMYASLAKEHTAEIPGLSRFVEWIKQRGLRRAAVSNSPRDNVEQVISALGLDDFFELVVIGNECERPKPFPDPYLKALQHFGVSAQQALVFEDSPAGTKAGAAAEIAVVGLTTGHPKAALLAAGASLIIEDYNDATLWAKLQRELGESEQEEQVSPGLLVQGPPDLLQLERTDPKQEVVQGIPVAQPEPPLQSSTT